jgi:site-specific DNA recombinase
MLEGMAEYYSRNLAQEVMKGLKENAYDCKFCGGIAPLGYDIDPVSKKFVINPDEVKAINLIFDMYIRGNGYSEIIRALNSNGYKTKTGHSFGKNSIYEILRNEKYTGTYIFNKAAKKINGKYNKHVKKNGDDIIRVEGGIPAIIPFDIWNQVQKTMNSRIRPGRKSEEVYLLSGLLHCGICGSAMTSDTRRMKDRDKSYYYYRCYKNNGKNNCTLQAWSRDDLEKAVIEKFSNGLFAGESLDKFADMIMRYYAEHESTINEDLEKVSRDLVAISKKVENIVEAIANGGNNFLSLKEKLSSLETQKNEYERKIAELEATKQFSIPTKADIKKYLSAHGDISKMDRPALKAYLNEKIRDIRVFPDQIDVDSIVNPIGCGRPYTITFTIAV